MTPPRWTLDIGTDRTVITADEHVLLDTHVSSSSLARRHWPGVRPSPLGLERAIDDIEEAIEASGARHEAGRSLYASARVRTVLAPLDLGAAALSRAAVEQRFSEMVRDAGAPGATADHGASDPAVGEAAAGLLMVRELMHHLGFEQLLQPDP